MKQRVISSVIRDYGRNLKSRPALAMGWALFCSWTWAVYFSLFLKPAFLREIRLSLSWIIPSGAVAVSFLIVGILFRTFRIVPQGTRYLRVVTFLMSSGTLCCAWAFYLWNDVVKGMPVFIVGSILMGIGSACMHLEFERIFGFLGARQTVIFSIVGVAGGACIIALFSILPLWAVWAAIMVFPVINYRVLKTELHPKLYKWGRGAILNVPWKLAITMFLQGLSFGIMQSISLLNTFGNDAIVWTSFCFAGAAILIFITALFFRLDFNHLIYQIGFPLMAVGYLIATLSNGHFPGGILIHAIGYRFIGILGWVLCAHLIRQHKLATNWVFPWSVSSLMFGSILGAFLGEGALNANLAEAQGIPILSIIMVFLLLGSALVMLDNKNLRSGWGLFRPSDFEEVADTIGMTCRLISNEYELTAREAEILAFLARGHNRAFICDKLVLSKETIKTHTRNIYNKIGLHSQQEIILLVEKRTDEQ